MVVPHFVIGHESPIGHRQGKIAIAIAIAWWIYKERLGSKIV